MSKPGRTSVRKEAAEQRYRETRRAIQGMKRILLRFRTQMDEQLRPQRVTIAQMQVLFAVRNAPGSSGAQLARSCYITPQTTQSLSKHLEKGGFIERGKHAVNDRIVTATVTPAGEKLVEAVEKEATVLQEKIWKGISDREVAQLNGLLERCLENFGGVDETGS